MKFKTKTCRREKGEGEGKDWRGEMLRWVERALKQLLLMKTLDCHVFSVSLLAWISRSRTVGNRARETLKNDFLSSENPCDTGVDPKCAAVFQSKGSITFNMVRHRDQVKWSPYGNGTPASPGAQHWATWDTLQPCSQPDSVSEN